MIPSPRRAALAVFLLVTGLPFSPVGADSADEPAAGFGNHAKVHFSVGFSWAPTTVLAIEDDQGALVMLAYVDENRLWATDGANDGVDRAHVQVGEDNIGSSWHRLDVILHGDTYTLHLDQRDNVSARTFVDTTQGTPVPDPRPLGPGSQYDEVRWERPRVDQSAMAHDTTFPPQADGWELVGNAESTDRRPGSGHLSPGHMEIANEPLFDLAYFRAPTTGMAGVYSAEASIAPRSNLAPGIRMAALAGLAGDAEDPEVEWAVETDRAPLSTQANRWALFFVDGEGARTLVSPTWSTPSWHTVKVEVDEIADRITVSVDDAPGQAFEVDLGTSTHVGFGDIDPGLTLLGRGLNRYDDVALYEEATP